MSVPAPRIPVTVLTGFLGSGKTTLLNRILREHHGQRIAVIENELGDVGVDQALVIDAEEEIFELSNGCICCRVRGDLIRILGSLLRRRDRLDRIVVETTGLANPGPVAQTFFIDEEIKSDLELDGIVTVVDAYHVDRHLESSSECQEQIAFADVLLLNKIDLVSRGTARRARGADSSYQPRRTDHRAERAAVDLTTILGVGGFDLARALSARPSFLEPEYPFEWTGIYDLDPGDVALHVEGGNDPSVDIVMVAVDASDTNSLGVAAERSVRVLSDQQCKAEAVLTPDKYVRMPLGQARNLHGFRATGWTLRAEHGAYAGGVRLRPRSTHGRARPSVNGAPLEAFPCSRGPGRRHRGTYDSQGGPVSVRGLAGRASPLPGTADLSSQGGAHVVGSMRRWVFQSVHMLLETAEDRLWTTADDPSSVLVFIGKGLDESELRRGFEQCLR